MTLKLLIINPDIKLAAYSHITNPLKNNTSQPFSIATVYNNGEIIKKILFVNFHNKKSLNNVLGV